MAGEQKEGFVGQSHLEPVEKILQPEELTHTLINTLRTTMTDPLVDLGSLAEKIEGEPKLEMVHGIITDSLADTKETLREFTDLAAGALAGQPLEIVKNVTTVTRKDGTIDTVDLSFIKLKSRSHPSDQLETIPKPTPEQINNLLIQTLHEETLQALSLMVGVPETPFLSRPGQPKAEPPRATELRAITSGFNQYADSIKDLESIARNSMSGNAIKVAQNTKGQQVISLKAA